MFLSHLSFLYGSLWEGKWNINFMGGLGAVGNRTKLGGEIGLKDGMHRETAGTDGRLRDDMETYSSGNFLKYVKLS